MSDDPNNSDEAKVGYRAPPKASRFKKGQSGNPRGRPRKQERSFMPRQVRNDVLVTAERLVGLNTREGPKKMPAAEALLQVVLARALSGHLPSIRYFYGLYQSAVREHSAAHYDRGYEMLEQLERGVQLASGPISPELLEHLNSMRRATRSIKPVVAAPSAKAKVRKGRNKS